MIYMLSYATYTDGLILTYATDEAGLKKIALDNCHLDTDKMFVEVDWENDEVDIVESDGYLISRYYIYTVDEVGSCLFSGTIWNVLSTLAWEATLSSSI